MHYASIETMNYVFLCRSLSCTFLSSICFTLFFLSYFFTFYTLFCTSRCVKINITNFKNFHDFGVDNFPCVKSDEKKYKHGVDGFLFNLLVKCD